jgi:hypothetical protein
MAEDLGYVSLLEDLGTRERVTVLLISCVFMIGCSTTGIFAGEEEGENGAGRVSMKGRADAGSLS